MPSASLHFLRVGDAVLKAAAVNARLANAWINLANQREMRSRLEATADDPDAPWGVRREVAAGGCCRGRDADLVEVITHHDGEQAAVAVEEEHDLGRQDRAFRHRIGAGADGDAVRRRRRDHDGHARPVPRGRAKHRSGLSLGLGRRRRVRPRHRIQQALPIVEVDEQGPQVLASQQERHCDHLIAGADSRGDRANAISVAPGRSTAPKADRMRIAPPPHQIAERRTAASIRVQHRSALQEKGGVLRW